MIESNNNETEKNITYIAHKEAGRIQTIKEHLQGTAMLASSFAERFGKAQWGYCCGMLHDIGKYSTEFQKKIWEDTNAQVDHSTAGAKLCNELGGYYSVLGYCIAGHHAGLPDYGNTAVKSSLAGRYSKKIPDYQVYKKEIQIPELNMQPILYDPKKNMDFSLSMFIRMLYSCLVDADYLDTESFMKKEETGRVKGEEISVLLEKLEIYISGWLKNTNAETINGRRTEILKHCLLQGKSRKGMFRLTVPTGGGKTIASLAFALKHAAEHDMDRIIYVIPYTSIIEQNASIFREILGNENVLEHHCNVEYKDSDELNPMQLAIENWDKPIIVTTNVQFFESLFGNKPSKCRKLHNISNSVVIFDEAQMLPVDYMTPCISALQELTENYRTSIVLCTATQPALDVYFNAQNRIQELCLRIEEQFQFFKRVTYETIGSIQKEGLIERLKQETSALCIVNTKKLAQDLYVQLKGEGVYHLSTSMYPRHRKQILQQIRTRLEEINNGEKKRCVLISTSLVEAGVDLDFEHVYRQTAGVDSMIQAAGRCNREGKRAVDASKVYIFDLEDTGSAMNQRLQIDIAHAISQDYESIADLDCIQDYFLRLYHHKRTSLDKKNIMNEFKNRKYNFAKVGKEFNLIEQMTKTIFVAKESEAEELLQEIKWKGTSKSLMRKAGQYCIQIYVNSGGKKSMFDYLYNAGMIREISSEIPDFYELTGREQYSEEYGLELSIDDEMAIFM